MATCECCGLQVKKLLAHPLSGDAVCMGCIPDGELLHREVREYIYNDGQERRTHIRVPISVALSFTIPDSVSSLEFSYPGTTVDLSMSGACFAWQHCQNCRVHDGQGMPENCIFHPFYTGNPQGADLSVSLNLVDGFDLTIPARVIYVSQEILLGVEYVGIRFTHLEARHIPVLEALLIRFGRLR